MRRGVTLTELLIGLVLIGLLALLAVPRLAALHDSVQVRAETVRLIAALDRARGAAVRLGSNTRLTLSDTGYLLTAAPIDTLTELWRAPGPAASAIQLSGAGAPLLFGPAGIAVGASNRTLILTKGSVSRRIILSRLGRITW